MCKEIKQLNEAAVCLALKRSAGTTAEVILRLAWNTGLSSGEMQEVTWQDVSFETAEICLPDRTVPIDQDLLRCLEQYRETVDRASEGYILTSADRRTQMNRVILSRLARAALDEAGLTEAHLTDLRHGYVLRQLRSHDWPYVARVSGLSLTTLRRKLFDCAGVTAASEHVSDDVTADSLHRLLEREGTSAVGLAVALSWKAGLRGTELVALTWEQIDFAAGRIHLPDRNEPMDALVTALLRQAQEERAPQGGDPVLLAPKTGRAMSDGHLSRMVRHALIRSGMDQLTLGALAKRHHEGEDSMLLARALEQGSLTRREAEELLGVSQRKAWLRLCRLVEQKQLVKVGLRYYHPGAVVPPEEQYPAIRAYLEKHGGAYRQELAELLRLEPRACSWVLYGLVEQGLLEMNRQWYTLPPAEDDM